MHESRWLKLYFGLCIAAGLGVLLAYTIRLTWTELLFSLAFAVGIGALEAVRFVFPSGEAVSVSSGLVLMVLWLFGPGAAMAADALAISVSGAIRRAPFRSVLFNIGQLVLSLGGAWLAYSLAGGLVGRAVFPEALPSLLLSGVVFFLLNSVFLEVGLALYKQASIWGLWWESVRLFWARWGISLAFGLFLVAAYPYFGPLFLSAVLLFVGGQYVLLRKYAEANQQRAVDSLLELAAARDQFRPGHSDRVLRYATALAEELGLGKDDVRLIRYAALLHDVGMSSVPQAALEKRAALTPAERARIQQHPADGARLVSRLAPLVPVARLVRHHHEHYDGSGYPDGLTGGDIPLGSRILAVADAFDSLTVDQPHRPACTPRMALEELRRHAGTDFDPQVVEGLARVLEREGTLAPRAGQGLDEEITLTIKHLKDYVAASRPAIGTPRPAGGTASAREEALLREIRQKAAGVVALYDLGRVINASLS
ncbi:MAG: HD-GYP domain-containing protein, partial [Acetobacteraceae bacterium]|nr:HD-GYP domain-containing protein [Acetobacteraceae bacterium]